MTIEVRSQIKETLSARDGVWVDLPSLLPAATLLELAGESLRPRLYFTNAPNGEEMCLRADLTIAAALYYIAARNNAPITLLCEGKVFRAPLNDNNSSAEFTQIGIEKFGDGAEVTDDVEIFLSVYSSCKTAGLKVPAISFADGSLIKSILQNAPMPAPWAKYLSAYADSFQSLKAAIQFAVNSKPVTLNKIEKSLLNLDDGAGAQFVAELIRAKGLQTGVARGPAQIAKRIKAKAERMSSAPLDAEIGAKLVEIMTIKAPPNKAIAEIADIALSLGIDLTLWRDKWNTRLEMIKNEIGKDYGNIVFEAMPHARFEYYDGMIFEIAKKGNEAQAIGFGGRYNGLISALSRGAQSANAVGATIRPERLLD